MIFLSPLFSTAGKVNHCLRKEAPLFMAAGKRNRAAPSAFDYCLHSKHRFACLVNGPQNGRKVLQQQQRRQKSTMHKITGAAKQTLARY